jgi:enoyl-CoA hydratase
VGESADILYERRGRAAIVTLNRPDTLNAVTLDMIRHLDAILDEAEADPAVAHVVVRAAGERAFAAGGDIRALYDWGREGRPELFGFFREEYRLNARIKRFPKPYVAVIHGIVMGGGAGISIHGSHRVVTERVAFAMPEVGIGFVPDIGGSHFLTRMPGRTGLHLGLTGARIGAADMLWAGLATHVVAHDRREDAVGALAEAESLDEALRGFAVDPGPARLAEQRAAIDALFARDGVEEILRAAESGPGPAEDLARNVAAALGTHCPTSLKAARRLLALGEGQALETCLVNEFRVVSLMVQRPDFYEGVRAAVIDKDRNPRWRPARLEEVPEDDIDALFQPSWLGDVVVA